MKFSGDYKQNLFLPIYIQCHLRRRRRKWGGGGREKKRRKGIEKKKG